jgi:hypothetical protein
LTAADVLLVFWTRHAARSEWERQECETFDDRFPARPLMPIRGDQTPLSKTLRSRQASDFCPLINELLALVRDLEAKGVGKREIRAALLRRREEEGIHPSPDNRRRLLVLFGIVGLTMAPLHFLEQQREALAERASRMPASTVYAAGAAAAGEGTGSTNPPTV